MDNGQSLFGFKSIGKRLPSKKVILFASMKAL